MSDVLALTFYECLPSLSQFFGCAAIYSRLFDAIEASQRQISPAATKSVVGRVWGKKRGAAETLRRLVSAKFQAGEWVDASGKWVELSICLAGVEQVDRAEGAVV